MGLMTYRTVLAAISLLILSSCGRAEHDRQGQQATSSDEFEKRISRLEQKARGGNEEALHELIDLHFKSDSQEMQSMGIAWLAYGANKGIKSVVETYIGFYLARGRCEEAGLLLESKRSNLPAETFEEMKSNVDECFERPVGPGDWSTRREFVYFEATNGKR